MKQEASTRLRNSISAKVRQLRIERRWTQARLAALLGLSQNRLSEIERGEGSFTAEQLLVILKTFNVPVDHFASSKASADTQLQNALARFGAGHLYESPDALPTETLKKVNDVVLQTLVGAKSPRQLTALAPVIVSYINRLNLDRLKTNLALAGSERLLGWVLENTLVALRQELDQPLSREWRFAYKRTETILANFLPRWACGIPYALDPPSDDILDSGIASQESVEQVRASSSEISKKWHIVTRIQTEDFVQALRASRGAD